MNLTIIYLGKKFEVTCQEDTYDYLTKEIAKQIGVPVGSQRLIFKGKSIQCGGLSAQGLVSKAKVMLIGNKSNQTVSEEVLAILDDVQLTIGDSEVRLEQLREELADFSQEFVPEDMRPSFVRSFGKRLAILRDQVERSRARLTGLTSSVAGCERCLRMGAALDELLSGADCLLDDFVAFTEGEEADADCAADP